LDIELGSTEVSQHSRSATLIAVDSQPVLAVGRDVIATIGIDRYRHWPALTRAVSDARGARAVFHGAGFEDAAEPLYDEQATGAAILALVTDGLMSLNEDDRLVVFYAGHGGARERRRRQRRADKSIKTGYLVPVDAESSSGKVVTWIDLDDLLRRIAALPPRHILVILDACYSGIALSPVHKWRSAAAADVAPLATLQARYSRRIITSALDDQLALDSGPVDGHSLFTGCLIEGLRGGAPRVGGATTGSALGLWLQGRVSSYPGSRQTPDVGAFEGDDRGELVIPMLDQRAATSLALPEAIAARASQMLVPAAIPGGAQGVVSVRRKRGRWLLTLRRRGQLWLVAAIVFWVLFLIGSALR
jgi:hypothetical protein